MRESLHHRRIGENRRGNAQLVDDTRPMPAALLAALALQASDATLADLEQAYDQTCNGRIYGQYDGMCSDMAARLKSYRAELRHRPKPSNTPAPSAAAVASPSPPVVPPATHEPIVPAAPKG